MRQAPNQEDHLRAPGPLFPPIVLRKDRGALYIRRARSSYPGGSREAETGTPETIRNSLCVQVYTAAGTTTAQINPSRHVRESNAQPPVKVRQNRLLLLR